MIMRKLLVLSVVAACGPKPTPAAIPMLPGDGDRHVVKPSPAPAKPAATDPWTGRTDLIPAPPGVPPTAIELPNIAELKLSNGLRVLVIKSDRLPVVAIQLAVRAGRMHEPRARLGVSELTAEMLVKGTQRRDAASLARAIDFVGGTIAADATFEATLLSCSVLVRNLNTCLELLPEMVTQPAFPEPELVKLRDGLVGTVRQRLDDAATLASAHAQNLLWGSDHVRGWVNSEHTVGTLRRDDVVAWHRQWFVPGNAILVVAGDVDARKLRGELERTFGAWRKAPVAPAPTYPEPGLSGSRIRLVDKPGQAVTHIRIAQFGIRHDDPRLFETIVWNAALGGGNAARLARAVRDTNAAFTASSSFDRNLDRGSFVASSATRNVDAVPAARQMLAEIARLAKDGPTKDEVAAAITAVTGSYGLRFQSASDLGAALISAELHGFGQEYLSNFPVVVGKVEVADAKRAASEILDPKAYVVVLVGDAKDLEPQLKKEGWRYEKVAFSQPITAPAVAVDAPADPAAIAAARKLIEEALVAKGGKPRLSSLSGFKLVAAGDALDRGQRVPLEISRVVVLPDKMRIDATFKPPGAQADTVVSIGVVGKAGWQRGPDPKTGGYTVADITGPGLTAIEFERWREPELILMKAADPAAKLSVAADEAIDGKPHAVIKLRSPIGDVDVLLYIDRKTKLIGRMSYSDGGSVESDDFADYRDVGGVKLAHKRTSLSAGRTTTLELKLAEIDPKIDPAVFAKPAS
jgi:predicted Zn-dependent peptidase